MSGQDSDRGPTCLSTNQGGVETGKAPADAVALTTLTPDPQNAHRHDQGNLSVIGLALREVGDARSVIVHETGTDLAGFAIVDAATGRVGLGANDGV